MLLYSFWCSRENNLIMEKEVKLIFGGMYDGEKYTKAEANIIGGGKVG